MNDKNFTKTSYKVSVADLSDAEGIYNALKSNLVEIEDVESLSEDKIRELEEYGFLRKDVNIQYYLNLIKDHKTDIFIAESKEFGILGFASIHKDQVNIYELRSTLETLYIDNQNDKELLLNKETRFIYLDQISILPEYKRIGIATKLMKAILDNNEEPIVAFIVKQPIHNKASALWHEYNGFKLVGTADGRYKGKLFEWYIYIHWNKGKSTRD